jgi:hypothetical protein
MNIDPLSIVTNGLITSDGYILIDPLGYYVIEVNEEIIQYPLSYGGGYPSSGGKSTKKVKRIKIKIIFNNISKKDYEDEVIVDDFELKIKNVEFDDLLKEIKINMFNPEIKDKEKSIKLYMKD